MSDTSQGTGGLTFDKTKRSWPSEMNVLLALIIIIVIFEILGQILPYMNTRVSCLIRAIALTPSSMKPA